MNVALRQLLRGQFIFCSSVCPRALNARGIAGILWSDRHRHITPATHWSLPVDDLTRLFSAYDRGNISRRHLLQALGLAAVSLPLGRALGQGQCAGRATDTTAACNKAPFK